MSFSENLKKIRKDNNMSQEEFAELVGVSRQAVSKWESGEGYPEVEKLLFISKELNVSLDSLMCSEILVNEPKEKTASGIITIASRISPISLKILSSVIYHPKNVFVGPQNDCSCESCANNAYFGDFLPPLYF